MPIAAALSVSPRQFSGLRIARLAYGPIIWAFPISIIVISPILTHGSGRLSFKAILVRLGAILTRKKRETDNREGGYVSRKWL